MPRAGCGCSRSGCSRPRAASPRRSRRTSGCRPPSRRPATSWPCCATEVEKLTAPPNAFGIVDRVNTDGTLDVITGGRKLRVGVAARHRGQAAGAGPGGAAQRGDERDRRPRLRPGRRGGHGQGACMDDGRVIVVGPRRRGAGGRPGRADADAPSCGWGTHVRLDGRSGLIHGAAGAARGRGTGPRGDPRRHLRADRGPGPARSRRSATRSSCPTSTSTCSRSTGSALPRECCSTVLRAAARP